MLKYGEMSKSRGTNSDQLRMCRISLRARAASGCSDGIDSTSGRIG